MLTDRSAKNAEAKDERYELNDLGSLTSKQLFRPYAQNEAVDMVSYIPSKYPIT